MRTTPLRLLWQACLILAGLAPALAVADEAAAIRSARLAQNAAIAAHDLDRIATCWTDDVVIQRGLGAQAIGKAAYLQLFRDDQPDAVVFERFPDAIEVGADWPLAFETGHWEGRQHGHVVIAGKYSAQWVKRGDHWLIRGEVYVALHAFAEGKQMPSVP
jgi:ketosteroid isomerase-like protein